MLKTNFDIRNDILVKLNQTTTVAFYTETILNDWIDEAYIWAAAVHKWPFTEGRVSTTYASLVTDEDGSLRGEYPEGWKSDSIRQLWIDRKRVQKLNHEDFYRFREDRPDADDRVFTDFGRLYYVNPRIDVSGTVTVWGQYLPADIDWTDNVATTVFSNSEEEGNTAITEEVLSYAYLREKNPQEAQLHHQRALEILEGIWKRITDEQFGYQTKDRGMWKWFDTISGGGRDDVNNPNRFV